MRKDLFGSRSLASLGLLVALLVPVGAAAQSPVETITISGFTADEIFGALPTGEDREATINIEGCRELTADLSDEITIKWDFRAGEVSTGEQYVVKLVRPGDTCTLAELEIGASDTCDRVAAPASLSEIIEVRAAVSRIFDGLDDPDACYDDTLSGPYSVYLLFDENDTETEDPAKDQVVFNVRLDRPDAPSGVTVRPGQDGGVVKWDEVDAAESYEVYVADDVTAFAVAHPEELTMNARRADSTEERVSGLDVGTTYYVAVVAVDENGNRSLVSEATEFTTVPSEDFWEVYRAAGGVEDGGCTSAGRRPGAPLWLLAAALGLVWARPRRRAGALAVAVVAFVPAVASASIVYDTEEHIRNVVEVKLGPYTPDIDSEFDGDGPYEEIFGSRTPLMLEAEYDYQLWRGVGSFGVFGSAGWAQVRGSAVGPDGGTTSDTTRLRLLPFRAGVVYRFDYLQTRWNVPLSFSAKLGLDYYAWFVRSNGATADARDPDGDLTTGRGGTTGWHFGLGGYFLLDALAPRMAANFASNSGVDNSYLFAELLSAHVNDFGGPNSWDLSDTTVQFGLAFEF